LTAFNTASTALATLAQEFQRGQFLSEIIFGLFGSNVTISSLKRDTSLSMSFNPCLPSSQRDEAQSLVMALAETIVPNAPSLQIAQSGNNNGCQMSVSATDEASATTTLIIPVAVVCGLLFLLFLIAMFYLYKLKKRSVETSPKRGVLVLPTLRRRTHTPLGIQRH